MVNEAGHSRPDIAEQEIVEGLFDIGHVRFRDYIKIFSDFFDYLVIEGGIFERLSIKPLVRERVESYLGVIRRCAAGEDVRAKMREMRVEAWEEFDRQDGADKALLRVVVIGLYDEVSAQYDDQDSSSNFEIIFATLNDVASDLCQRFRAFLENCETMTKYRI